MSIPCFKLYTGSITCLLGENLGLFHPIAMKKGNFGIVFFSKSRCLNLGISEPNFLENSVQAFGVKTKVARLLHANNTNCFRVN